MSTSEHIPKVTVLLPVYNAAQFLRQAIDSILSQSCTDFELLIVNDGSTDSSVEIIASYTDSRIRVLNNEKNVGLIASLNRGISEAKGKYIARMDADDVSLPGRLQHQVTMMENDGGISVLGSFVDFMNVDGEVTGNWSTDREATSEREIRKLMMRTNCIAHPTVMMRTDVVRKYLYNPKRKGAEDWDLWMRMLADGFRIAKLPEVLLNYRIHPGSVTAGDKAEEVLEGRLMRFKRRWLWSQFEKFKLNGFFFGVKISLLKNIARHIVSNKIPAWLRDVKRFLTSPPWKVIAQGKKFRETLEKYSGSHYFIFPYMHVGGAEKVHAAIVETVKDRKPLVIFSSWSDDESFLSRFTANATVLDVAHYVNYPLTRRNAKAILAASINSNRGIVLGSNAGLFYDILPMLNSNTKAIDVIHAFKYQPGANLAHRKLLSLASRIDHRVFVSQAAKTEFDTFCFHNNIPRVIRERLQLVSNGVKLPETTQKPEGNPGVLFVGRDSPEKRLNLFYKVAYQFDQESRGKLRFTVVGADSKITFPFITFEGEIADEKALELIYRDHDILVVTSSREGFPVVIMEAMANGLAVIATPVGDIPNRLNGENGIVLSTADEDKVVAEVVAEIKKLLDSPDQLAAMKNSARKYAETNFSEEKFRSEYRKLLNADQVRK